MSAFVDYAELWLDNYHYRSWPYPRIRKVITAASWSLATVPTCFIYGPAVAFHTAKELRAASKEDWNTVRNAKEKKIELRGRKSPLAAAVSKLQQSSDLADE